jgi:hypothetical protein
MKLTAHKYTMVPFIKIHLLNQLSVKFMPLAQMELRNGGLILHNPLSAWNHFGLLTIFLVLEDHEMMC